MRTTSMLKPTFWTRGSGKKLRGKPEAQVLAAYLMTSPHSSMLGIYYESMVTILHNTGLTEAGFRKAMAEDGIREIVQYDEEEGLVYLPGGAEHQIGEVLTINDKKRSNVLSQLKPYGKHPFVRAWIERYYDSYNLGHNGIARPIRTPSDAPSVGDAALLHPPDPDQTGPDPDPDQTKARAAPDVSLVADIGERARLWVRDQQKACLVYPSPHRWGEATELAALVAEVFGHDRPDELRGPNAKGELDSRVRLLLERWAEGTDQARMRQAIRGAKKNDLISSKPELQSLQTILKDANAVDKYCRLAKSNEPSAARTKPGPRKPDPDEEYLDRIKREQNRKALESATPEEIAAAEGKAKAIATMAGSLFRG